MQGGHSNQSEVLLKNDHLGFLLEGVSEAPAFRSVLDLL